MGTKELSVTETLFNKSITWGDGSSELVQIDKDGYFYLDEVKRRLVGLELGASFPAGDNFLNETLALIEKELTFLQSIGIRTIEVLLPYNGNNEQEKAYYSTMLDVLYKHKMLVLPIFTAKWVDGFNNMQEGDFQIGNGDTVGAWALRWISTIKQYPNVVMVAVENEIDHQLDGQFYSPDDAAYYMEYITGVFRTNLPEVPILTKLMGHFPDGVADVIKSAVFPHQDIPGWDPYTLSADDMAYQVEIIKNWMKAQGWNGEGWWITETGAQTSNTVFDASAFNVSFLESQFERGVTASYLWTANNAADPVSAFFDSAGNPIPALVEIGQNISRLQAPVTQLEAGNIQTSPDNE